MSKVAVVTGAASGIGRATAELFAERGWNVVVNDIVEIGWADDSFATVAGSTALDEVNAALVAAAIDRWGRLDAAVLNAGTVGNPAWDDPSAVDRFDEVVAVNLRGVMLGIRHAAPAMSARGGGAIVATASTSAFGGDPVNYAYNATKAGVVNLIRAAAMDFGSSNVRVNAVAPGPTQTGMTTRLNVEPALHQHMAERTALGRWGEARELAEAMYFLCSERASFVTGVVLPVDGGLSANAGHWLPSKKM